MSPATSKDEYITNLEAGSLELQMAKRFRTTAVFLKANRLGAFVPIPVFETTNQIPFNQANGQRIGNFGFST